MKTDLQKFKDLLNELEVGYKICNHVEGVRELCIHPKHVYQGYCKNEHNVASIVFDKDEKFMYFDGISI